MKPLAVWIALSFVPVIAVADPVTLQRVSTMPAAGQAAWRDYLKRSSELAAQDQAALDAEVKAARLPAALPTPDGGDFKVSKKAGDPYYASEEAKALTDVILSYQTPSGGWSKHTGYSKGPRKPGQLFSSQYKPGAKPHYLATFDNRSFTAQMEFLAYVIQATGRKDCKQAFAKGLNYVLAAQYPNGGWPQVFPLEGGYHDDVTFNDDAMTHVLNLLNAVATKQPAYEFVDDARRAKAADAVKLGTQFVLKSQVEVNGRKTVWCAQYDAVTAKPSNARKFEPATLSGQESARILLYLMSLPNPSPEVIASVEGGLAFLEQAKVTNISKATRNGKTVYDENPASTEVYWARFYDLQTGQPVFPGRDGVMHKTFNEMAAGKNVGYDYYTTAPGSVLTTAQKKWRKATGR